MDYPCGYILERIILFSKLLDGYDRLDPEKANSDQN